MQKSYFYGGMLTYILSYIISFFIITLTFGLGTPWAICIMYKWEIEHTVIEGLMELLLNYLETGSNGFSYVSSH